MSSWVDLSIGVYTCLNTAQIKTASVPNTCSSFLSLPVSTSPQRWPLLCPLSLGECLINRTFYFLARGKGWKLHRILRALIFLGCSVCPLLWEKSHLWLTTDEHLLNFCYFRHDFNILWFPLFFNGKQVLSFLRR